MRFAIAAILAALTLAACGQAPSGAAKAGDAPAAQADNPDRVHLSTNPDLPDWLLVAYQTSGCPPEEHCERGAVHYNRRTISRHADGTADIWVQVRYPRAQLYNFETETTQTTIRYELERLHYRFQCAEQKFYIAERQIMGANDTVVARDEPPQIWRAPVHNSVTFLVMPIACHGS